MTQTQPLEAEGPEKSLVVTSSTGSPWRVRHGEPGARTSITWSAQSPGFRRCIREIGTSSCFTHGTTPRSPPGLKRSFAKAPAELEPGVMVALWRLVVFYQMGRPSSSSLCTFRTICGTSLTSHESEHLQRALPSSRTTCGSCGPGTRTLNETDVSEICCHLQNMPKRLKLKA